MRNLLKQKKTGFTLVETLVAISIFTMSILGLMSILASGIADTNYAKQKMIASYLAQEGVETIRNLRDNYVLYDAAGAQHGWDAFRTYLFQSPQSCYDTNGCYFYRTNLDYSAPPVISACSTLPCPNLRYDSATGKYDSWNTGTNTDSGFSRQIKLTQISPPSNGDELKVTSIVSWRQGSGNYSITFSENLYNWVE